MNKLSCNQKTVYIVQPYKVGSSKYESLAIIIPSTVKKKFNITTSSVFSIHEDSKINQLVLTGPILVP